MEKTDDDEVSSDMTGYTILFCLNVTHVRHEKKDDLRRFNDLILHTFSQLNFFFLQILYQQLIFFSTGITFIFRRHNELAKENKGKK